MSLGSRCFDVLQPTTSFCLGFKTVILGLIRLKHGFRDVMLSLREDCLRIFYLNA